MGFHWPELLGLVIIALLIFGPKRLPEMGSSIGKTIREFQKSMREVTAPVDDAVTPVAPPVEPKQVAAPTPAATVEAPAPPVAAVTTETPATPAAPLASATATDHSAD